jgi:hypothetical protein
MIISVLPLQRHLLQEMEPHGQSPWSSAQADKYSDGNSTLWLKAEIATIEVDRANIYRNWRLKPQGEGLCHAGWPFSPTASATSCIPLIVSSIRSSNPICNIWAPFSMIDRSTPAANLLSFHLFFTDFT